MCKGDIKLSELKENKIIEEIENILKNNQNQNNKINELSALIQEKKKLWEDQTNNINNLIEKIFKFQEDLEKYKKEFHEFMIKCQSLVDSTFQDVNLKMESLINSLLSYNNVIDDSIKKYNDIYDKNQKNRYGNNNIKQFINEIIALERKHFNDKTFSEVENFLY
jgi:ASC-1-like (ASCH) protein